MRCVDFNRGAVSCIEADFWWIKMRGKFKRGWYVKVFVRDDSVGRALYAAMREETRESLDMSYEQTPNFVWVSMARIKQRSGWLAWIIGYLSKAGHLDRNQELTAYVSFGLPYESPL
jgi:hypothetical protein